MLDRGARIRHVESYALVSHLTRLDIGIVDVNGILTFRAFLSVLLHRVALRHEI